MSTVHPSDIPEDNKNDKSIDSEERFRAFMTATSDAVYRMSPDWHEMRYLQGRKFIPDTENPTSTWLEKYIPPDDQQNVTAVINEAIRNKSIFELEHRIVRIDGTLGWTFSRAVPLLDNKGDIVEWIGTARDITARKRTRETLRESEERLSIILENMPVGVWIVDSTGRVNSKNKAADRLWAGNAPLSMRPEDYVEYAAWDVETGKRLETDDYPLARTLRTGHPISPTELRIRRFDGSEGFIMMSTAPLNGPDGLLTGAVGINIDITERKRAEEALHRFNEALEQQVAERTKLAEARARQLQALVSELTIAEQRERTRLAEILHDNLQQLLVSAAMNCEILSLEVGPEQKPTTEDILVIIRESIKVSRTLTAELSPPVLKQGRLSAALEWLRIWKKEKYGLTIELHTNPDLDPERKDVILFMFQSIRELLFNIVKHSGTKSACVEMSGDKKTLGVTVSDRGNGFDPSTIWEKAQSGTGFGLFSIRERLELMGGRLEVTSSPGKGAAFSLIIPHERRKVPRDKKATAKTATEPYITKEPGDKIRILMVDDHRVVRQGITAILERNYDVKVIGEAADGNEAVRMARDLQPDVILMDIHMPNMNGIEATRIIHSEFLHIQIIGLSMYEDKAHADAMKEAGAIAYCTKDGDFNILLSAIRERFKVSA